ncbi:MAG: hypothetical protein AAF368_12325, partial [Planctomycetota bacterium]
GFYPPDAASPDSNLATATSSLSDLKSMVDAGAEVDSMEDVIPLLVAEIQKLNAAVNDRDNLVTTLRAEKAAAAETLSSVSSEKDGQLSTLQSNLSDTEQSMSDETSRLQSELAGVNSQLSDSSAEIRDKENELTAAERQKQRELAEKQARIAALADKVRFITEEPQTPDGEILAVSTELGLGWIDIGNDNRLALGTRFAVLEGTAGSDREKAFAEVIGVEKDMAEIKFLEIKDRFDPPTKGDKIVNPIFDPKSERFAILVGRFSGSYSENDLTALLAEMNIKVQNSLDETTDYMIVGAELYQDEEGEPLEEPMQASELSSYKEAVAKGVQVVPLKDIRAYFSAR